MVRSSAADDLPTVSPASTSLDDLLIDAARQGASVPLIESLLHDVRNPLNAIVINLEVLCEKLKSETGFVPPHQEKNLKAMREQVHRVDVLMRRFAGYLVPTEARHPPQPFSELVQEALELLAPELRRKRLKAQPVLATELRSSAEAGGVRTLCLQLILRAVQRAAHDADVRVVLHRSGAEMRLDVEVSSVASVEGAYDFDPALAAMTRRLGGRIELLQGRSCLALPLLSQ